MLTGPEFNALFDRFEVLRQRFAESDDPADKRGTLVKMVGLLQEMDAAFEDATAAPKPKASGASA